MRGKNMHYDGKLVAGCLGRKMDGGGIEIAFIGVKGYLNGEER